MLNLTLRIRKRVDIKTHIKGSSFDPKLDKIIVIKIPNDFGSSGDCEKISDVFPAETVPRKVVDKFVEEKSLVFTWEKDDVAAKVRFQNKILKKIINSPIVKRFIKWNFK